MFKKENKNNLDAKNREDLSGNSINLIGDGTRINGEMQTETDIRVDGKLDGNMITKGKLVLGENALITGNSYCHTGEISGKINGDIYCKDLLNLKSTAQVSGDIYTKRLVVEKDASFNGKCEMKGEIQFPDTKTQSDGESSEKGNEQSTGKEEPKGQSKQGGKTEKTSSV